MAAKGQPKLKAALTAFRERYALPAKPPAAPPAVQDAYRQTQFLLSEDLAIFERAMNLQLTIVAANAKARTAAAAAVFTSWSRTFSHLADACTVMTLGSYVSCPPLLRAALDCLAVQRGLIRDGYEEYEAWFVGAISQTRGHQALAYEIGRYRAASVLAEDEHLGPLYRLLTDLSMPHFGSTAFITAPDSGLQKLAIGFADQSFHLAWAEVISGWLLLLAQAQLETAVSSPPLRITEADLAAVSDGERDVRVALGSGRRCYVEEIDGRFLFYNFRRKPGGQPKRLMI